MTLSATHAPTPRAVSGGQDQLTGGDAAAMPTRSFEIAALRADGSMYIGQDRAPALPLFEAAFSAFARGTLIETTEGPVAVEDLQPGDMILTATGAPAPLVWIGSSNFVPADTGWRMPLLRIVENSFGSGRPESLVTVGPAARLLQTPPQQSPEPDQPGMLIPALHFVDGENIIMVTPPTPVRLFHICLDRHAVIVAGGIEMETFHPDEITFEAAPEALQDRFLSLFPRIAKFSDFGPLAHPRMPDAPAD